MSQEYTTFKGISNISESTLTEVIRTNLYFFLNWGFLEIGAYFNVNIPTSGAYGGNDHRLRPVRDKNFADGRIWSSFHGNWVWESGVNQPVQPIRVSGAYINGSFNTANYIDYSRGRVVFNSGISTTSTVTAEYSYRYVNIYDYEDIPWLKKVQYNTFRSDSDQYLMANSGLWNNMDGTAIQLPAVIYEVADGRYSPYALGGGTKCHNVIVFHILAEDSNTVDKIADILGNQYEKTIFLFDKDYLASSGVFPLDHLGRLNNSAKTYPQIVEAKEDGGYRWRKLTIESAEKQPKYRIHDYLYSRPVRLNTWTVLNSI